MNIRKTILEEFKILRKDGKGISLCSVATVWGLLVGARMVYPVLLPYLQTSYGLSLSVAGLLVAILWFFGSLGQLPSGMLADKYNERLLMATSAIIVASSLVFVIISSTPVILFIATGLWGLGHSLYPIARITFLSDLYTDRLGSALGVTMATGDIGQTILPPIVTILAVAITWRIGLGFMIPFIALGAILLLVTLPDLSPAGPPSSTHSILNISAILSELQNRRMKIISIALFLYIFIWQSFTAFYPTYLTNIKGLSPTVASVLFGLFFAIGVVTKPIAGVAYDQIGMQKSLIGVLFPSVVGFAVLPIISHTWHLMMSTVLISTMLGSGAITQSYLADSFSAERQGTGLGVIRTVTATFGAGGPIIFGLIADFGYFNEGYLFLAVIMSFIIFLIIIIE